MWGKGRSEKNILIIGGFNKAKALSISLLKKGYYVTVINKNYEDCEKLAEVKGLDVIYGDGSKRFILESANAEDFKVAIALTDSDEKNLIICEMCKKFFNINKTVSLLNDPSKTNFFYEMGIDRVVCALNTITNIMEGEAIMDEMTKLISVEKDKIHIIEISILKNSEIAGKKLWELNLPKEIIIGCIIRDEESLIPRGDTSIKEGDILLIITSDKGKLEKIKELKNYASRK